MHRILIYFLQIIHLSSISYLIHEIMKLNNNVTEFILLGLSQDPVRKKIVFVTFLFLYLGTLLGNFLIISTIKTSRTLGSPMSFFLFHLSLSDTFLSTSIAPRVIPDALRGKSTISFNECMTQVFASHFFGCLEIFILILMAVDRYVAICKPLRYMTLMSHRICGVLVAVAWVGSCIHSSAQILLASSLSFCGPNVIDHWSLINFQPLLKLLVQTPMWPTYSWCPTVGPSVQWVLPCWCSPMLWSCILWETTVLRGGRKPYPPASLT